MFRRHTSQLQKQLQLSFCRLDEQYSRKYFDMIRSFPVQHPEAFSASLTFATVCIAKMFLFLITHTSSENTSAKQSISSPAFALDFIISTKKGQQEMPINL